MKKKYLISLLTLAIMISGIVVVKHELSNSKDVKTLKTYDAYSYLIPEVKNQAERVEVLAEFEHAYTPEYMLEVSDAVALVSVISIEGADTKIDSAVGSTYGKMVIRNIIYGNIMEGSVISYFKSGGIMSLEEYDKYQIPSAREKHERMRKENGVDGSKVYRSFHFENDPEIEEGKTYLCYLKYNDKLGKYEVIGLGNGFREVNIPKTDTVDSGQLPTSNLKILNNNTGDYESLEDYIKKNIK